MATSDRISVQPAVLEWARATAGLDVATAARRLGLSEATLQRWGKAATSNPRSSNSDALPPAIGDPSRYSFCPRLLATFKRSGISANTRAQRRHATRRGRHNFMRSSRDRYPNVRSSWSWRTCRRTPSPETQKPELASDTAADAAGGYLRQLTGLDSLPARVWADPRDALNQCIAAVEDLGIIVLQTKGVAISEMRGFSISNWPFPVVALNGSDWPRPRLFTLFHELCHVALNDGGLCDLHETRSRGGPADVIEHFCNAVAGSALLPTAAATADPEISAAASDYRWSLEELAGISGRYGLSSEAVLLRLITRRQGFMGSLLGATRRASRRV